jgi:anti-anti-sigma factor
VIAVLTNDDCADIVETVSETAGNTEAATLRLVGDVDALTQAGYRERATELLDATDPNLLVVDMAELATIDSSGLGLLVFLHSLTSERNIAMVLTNAPPRARALLRRTGLDRVFTLDTR